MKARAKFRCDSVENFPGDRRNVKFTAVTDDTTPENERFTKYTPSGQLQMSIDNPDLEFVPGRMYYLDFTIAPLD